MHELVGSDHSKTHVVDGSCQGETRTSELRPEANERVGAFGQRAELLQHELADVGRAVTNRTMIDAMLSGWLKERPEWDVVVQSLRTTIGVNETVATGTQRLTQQEVEQVHALRVRCPAALAAVSAPAADDQRWCRMEVALQQVTTAVVGLQQGAEREPTGQGAARQGTTAHGVGPPQRRCYRCGSVTHMWRECPHPFAGQGALSSGAQCSEWMLDSGCNHDMHHGGDLRERAFSDYRMLDKPILVFFVKRGVTAAAVGSGTMALQACEGPLILRDVLYVPELDGLYFR
jgi:hypothetical protein